MFRLFVVTILSALATFFAFQENALFPFSVFIFPAVLYYTVLQETDLRRICLHVWIICLVTFSLNLYWVSLPIHEVGKIPIIFAFFIVCLLASVLSLFYLLFTTTLWYVIKKSSSIFIRTLFAATVWIIVENLLSFVFTGFPWLTLPVALVQWPSTVALASVVGTYTLSGIFVFLTLLLFEGIRNRSAGYLTFSVFLWCAVLGTSYTLFVQQKPKGLPLNVALIQGNILQNEKWSTNAKQKILHQYIALSEFALQEAAQDNISVNLLIWPETALPFLLVPNSTLETTLLNFIKKTATPLLTGNLRYGGNTTRNVRLLYNSALLFSYDATLTAWYDKEKLVPFGEYTPFFLRPTTDLFHIQLGGSFAKGFNNMPLTLQNIPFGVAICYEILFPYIIQRQVSEGAQFLVTISNDAWFGHTRAAWQHLQHAKLRAIEQNRYVARATNTGISAIISPKGLILTQSPLFTEYTIVQTLHANLETSIYHAIADYIFWIALTVAFLLFFIQHTNLASKYKRKYIIRRIV